MKPSYSGDKSRAFWKRVNKLRDNGDLYALAGALQSLEGIVLKMLVAAEKVKK